MKSKTRFLLLITFLITLGIKAQDSVSGLVTETGTNEPLPGVNIVIKGTTTGTTSDFDGNYQISAKQGDVLLFSYISFKTKEVTVNANTINVALETDTAQLEEVVVIGYGTTTVKDATGSIEKVSTDEFNAGAITSPEQLITGKTAGVSVVAPGGQPGQGATITIRGNSSLSANNSPLIVIDGVPIDQGTSGGSSVSALNSINPNDIESFVVLKDASSTAIYGSRASAGVILITTKKGATDSPLKVEIGTQGSIGTATKRNSVLTPEQYREAAATSSKSNLIVPFLGSENTDWQDLILQDAVGTNTNITLSKGFKGSSLRASLGYTTQEGVVIGSKFERTSASINFRQNLFDNTVKLALNLRGSKTKDDFIDEGVLSAAARFDPTQPVYSGSSEYGGYYEWLNTNGDGRPNNLAPKNPLGLIKQPSNNASTDRALGNLKIDYYVPFVEGLNVNVNLGFDYNQVSGEIFVPGTSAAGFYNGDQNGTYGGIRRSYLIDTFLNYSTDIESIKSKIEVTAGHSFQKFYRDNGSNNTYALAEENSDFLATHNALESYVLRARYSYDSRYLLTLSYRTDGSSRFSSNNRWGNFSAAALAWNISEESFLKDSKTISNLKLRLGYGQTGQQEIFADFGYLPTYLSGSPNQQYQFGNTFYPTIRPGGYDENLKWEEAETYNIGLDYGFLNNRITGSVEYYTRESKDILNLITVPAGTNLTNQLVTNIGNLENSGVEFSIAADIIQKDDFNWNLGFNASWLTSEVTKLNTTEDPTAPTIVNVGGISGGVGNTVQAHVVGYPQNSFLVYQQVYDTNGKPLEGVYVDRDGDGVSGGTSDPDDLYLKEKPNADYLLGMSSYTNYKNWDLSFAMRASIGNYVYNNVASSNGNNFSLNDLGSNRNVHSSFLETGFETNNNLLTDYYIQDASFLRMDNITLGFNFKDLLSNDKIGLRAQATVQNVFVITNYDGIDPEISGGIDNNFFPRPRTILLGLNLNF